MEKKKIFVFGNTTLAIDAVPVRILSSLGEKFPELEFIVLDPNEDWDMPKKVIIIDTVVGITDVTLFEGLSHFAAPPRISCHDFDAYANLRLMEKIGKLTKIDIIGVPPSMQEEEATEKISAALHTRISA